MAQDAIDLTGLDSESSVSGSSSGEPVEYRKWKRDLHRCLEGITSSGDFSLARQYQSFINPCLRITGQDDVIPLPLTKRDAEAIRAACREAPFGKGDETLVDTSVRKTWELDAAQFQCTNPSWNRFFDTLLNDVATGLGLQKISAKPHKLLLYEEGSFFKRHKDSEKEAGMIATLVVCLPAVHTGGAVHLSFGTEKREIVTAPASPFDITALAWFSDVYHEVKPLESGHRLVLTYKLFQSSGDERSASFLLKQSQQLKSILEKWRREASMIVYPLDHQYTKSSLSLKNMKGRDRFVCHSLRQTGDACGLYLTLAHMTHEDGDPDDYLNSEKSTTLDTIYSCEGTQIGSNHDVEESQILGSNLFQDRSPDSEDEGEFTGNESMPATFRYHDTVAVLIPKREIYRYLQVDSYSGIRSDEARGLLDMLTKDFRDHPENAVLKSSILQAMTKVLDTIPRSKSGMIYYGNSPRSAQLKVSCTIAKWALEVKQEDLYQKAVKIAMSYQGFPTELLDAVSHFLNETFANSAEDIDWGKWCLGPFLSSTSLGSWFSVSTMITAHLGTKPLQDSFGLWARSQLDVKLDTQTSFGLEDHDFIIANLGRAEINDKMASAFALRGTRDLIFKVLDSIFKARALYSDNVVKSVFEGTLENARSRLALKTSDISPQSSYVLDYSYAYGSRDTDKSTVLWEQFTALINHSLIVGVSDQAIGLIEESHKALIDANSSWPTWNLSDVYKNKLVRDLLAPLASALHTHGVSPTPGIRGFFELLIRCLVHYKVPAYPKKLEGWRHREQGCGSRDCEDCVSLNAFLDSPDQRIWELRAIGRRRRYVDSYLPSTIFKKETLRGRTPYALVVEKRGTEHAEELKTFHQSLKSLENVVAPLQGDACAGILGDAKYRELILFENIKMGAASGTVTGVKRPSDDDIAGDSVRQRR
ncbi:hypothetical protein M426DRAFT_16317 [Hypoxylon sp. CI-4A]|nr:hypothetical protein M426DRAFT_16317 [Hypoxylon sp. CI-4A]